VTYVVPCDKERENAVVFDLRGLPLSFCKGDFCHLLSENAGQFERKSMCLRGEMSKWLAQFK